MLRKLFAIVVALLIGATLGSAITAGTLGRYRVTGKPSSFILLDRFTGEVQACYASSCDVVERASAPKLASQ